MLPLYIIGGIVILLVLFGLIRADLIIRYAEGLGLVLSVAGIPISIFPGRKKKIKLRDYSPKAIERRRRKAEKKAAKKAAKAEKKAKKDAKKAEKAESGAEKKTGSSGEEKEEKFLSVPEIISLATSVITVFAKRFAKSMHVRVARLHIAVASEDAAKTALLYGAVSQGVCYLAALLDSCGKLKQANKADVRIYADYLKEKPVIDMEIVITLRNWQIIDITNRMLWTALKKFLKILKKKK